MSRPVARNIDIASLTDRYHILRKCVRCHRVAVTGKFPFLSAVGIHGEQFAVDRNGRHIDHRTVGLQRRTGLVRSSHTAQGERPEFVALIVQLIEIGAVGHHIDIAGGIDSRDIAVELSQSTVVVPGPEHLEPCGKRDGADGREGVDLGADGGGRGLAGAGNLRFVGIAQGDGKSAVITGRNGHLDGDRPVFADKGDGDIDRLGAGLHLRTGLFGRQFIRLWAGEGYDDAYIIAMLFFVPLTVPLIQNFGITILQARNQMKFRSLLYLVISFVSLGAQIPLSKYYGGIGCACAIAGALVLGQIIVMNVYYQVKQKIDIVGFWIEIIKMSIVPAVLTVLTYYVLQQYALDTVVKLVAGIVLYLVVYLPLFFTLSMNAYERDLILKPIKKILKRV